MLKSVIEKVAFLIFFVLFGRIIAEEAGRNIIFLCNALFTRILKYFPTSLAKVLKKINRQ